MSGREWLLFVAVYLVVGTLDAFSGDANFDGAGVVALAFAIVLLGRTGREP